MRDAEFIKWSGGSCPVPANAEVVVRYRDGTQMVSTALWHRWEHSSSKDNRYTDSGLDIVEYKLTGRVVDESAKRFP